MEQPLLSVFVITYKQASFIRQTLESILNQETHFDFEVIVANDCSPDNTTEIIEGVIGSHPKGGKMTYFEHTENLGMYENFMFALRQCQGKYVAICEGDDYWIDALKLQKQVDFLEVNPDYEVCFTNIRIVDEHDVIIKPALITDDRKTDYERQDLPIWAPTLTRVFRNRDFSSLPSAPGLDTIMLLWQSHYGKIKFLNEVTGVYRKHASGVYSLKSSVNKKEHTFKTLLIGLELIESSLYSKYFGMLLKKLVEIYYLDTTAYKINKTKVVQAFTICKNNMTCGLRIKIKIAFFLISVLVTMRLNLKSTLLKVFNYLFIY